MRAPVGLLAAGAVLVLAAGSLLVANERPHGAFGIPIGTVVTYKDAGKIVTAVPGETVKVEGTGVTLLTAAGLPVASVTSASGNSTVLTAVRDGSVTVRVASPSYWFMLISGPLQLSPTPSPPPPPAGTTALTPEDNGRTLTVPTGTRFSLTPLSTGERLLVTASSDPAVVGRNGTGWSALSPGSSVMMGMMEPVCTPGTACPQFILVYRVTIVVVAAKS